MAGFRSIVILTLLCPSSALVFKFQDKNKTKDCPVGLIQVPGFGMDLDATTAAANQNSYQTGYLRVDCVKDSMRIQGDKHGDNADTYGVNSGVSVVFYDAVVDNTKHEAMTPLVCFNFCRTIEKAQYFGLHNGRSCYCAPFYKAGASDSSQCDSSCEGDEAQFCGGVTKSGIYSMHNCGTAGNAEKINAAKELVRDTFESCEDAGSKLDSSMNEFDAAADLRKYAGTVGDTVTSANAQLVSAESLRLKDDAIKTTEFGEEGRRIRGALNSPEEGVKADIKREEAIAEGTALHRIAFEYCKNVAKNEYSARRHGDSTEVDKQHAYYPVTYWVENERVHKPDQNVSTSAISSACTGKLAGPPVRVGTVEECAKYCNSFVSGESKCIAFQFTKNAKNALHWHPDYCIPWKYIDEAVYYTGVEAEHDATTAPPSCADPGANMCFAKFSESGSLGLRMTSKDAAADHIKQQHLKRCWNQDPE